MQVSNFGGTFDQLFLWIFFMKFPQKMPLYLFYTMVQKSQKWPKTQTKRGGGGGSCLKGSSNSTWVWDFKFAPAVKNFDGIFPFSTTNSIASIFLAVLYDVVKSTQSYRKTRR